MNELATMDPTQQLAFELWALKCDRRMGKVRNELRKLGHDIPLATLNQWAKQGEWAANVRPMFETIMPDTEARTWSTMSLASEEASWYLRNVISGNFWPELDELPEEERPADDDPYFDPAFVKIRADTANKVMLMTGWSPSGGFTKEKPHDPYQLKTEKPLAEMSSDDLFRLEQERIEQITARKQEQDIQNRRKRRSNS